MIKFFQSRQNTVGIVKIADGQEVNKKVKAHVTTEKRAVIKEDWENHFKGATGLGLSPILENNTCKWGAIDIDTYPFDVKKFSKKFQSTPFFFCRTKSGGMHIYTFFEKEMSSKKVRLFLEELSYLLGFTDAEVFPKQENIKEDGQGSWINLPYFGGNNTNRYCFYNGVKLTKEQFTHTIENNLISSFKEALSRFKLAGAPPCLQKMFAAPIASGERTNSLLNLGVFLKRKHKNSWKEKLLAANKKKLDEPLKDSEVNRGIIGQLEKKEIFYQCKSNLASFCDKNICKNRLFGVGGQNEIDKIIGRLSKIETIPPIWRLTIEIKDKKHEIDLNTDDLLDFNKVRCCILEKINKVLPRIKADTWEGILNERIENVEIIDAPDDANIDNIFYSTLEEFCVKRSNSRTIEDILNEKVFVQNGFNLFKSDALYNFLKKKSVTRYQKNKMYIMLKNKGGKTVQRKIGDHAVRLWAFPIYERQKNLKTNKRQLPKWEKTDEEVF